MKRYKLRYPGLVFFLYLLTIFPATMNAVRQGVAVSIMFYAFTFILNKKPLKYTLLTLLAGLFHISALLLIPFYFLGRLFDVQKRSLHKLQLLAKSRFFIRLGLVLILLSLVMANVFTLVLGIPGFEKYELYLNLPEEGSNYIFYIRLFLLITILLLAKYTIFKGDYRQNAFIFAGAMVEIIILILGFASPFIKREALYFSPFLIMLLPNIINLLEQRVRYRFTLYTACLLYGISFFTVSYLLLDQANIIPYNSSVRSVE
ncbi:EpsG family protein, partial [Candidatus Saccharibacteria bacterium]|nr:EpsG family protein [Candidatus Saccharibacteria bacterium]